MYSVATRLLVAAALAVACVNGGEHPCVASAPDFQQCVRANLQHLIPQLAAGVPSIGAASIDPLQGLPPVKHSTPNLGVQLDDVVLNGLSTAVVNDINVDLVSNTIRIQSSVPGQLIASGVQTTEADIMGIPLRGSGPFTITIANPSLDLTLSGTPAVGPDGQSYLRLSSASATIQPGPATIDVGGFFTQFTPLARAANAFANSVAAPVVEELRPSLEKWVASIALERAQAVFGSVPYDALFPGRTPAAVGLYRALPALPLGLQGYYK